MIDQSKLNAPAAPEPASGVTSVVEPGDTQVYVSKRNPKELHVYVRPGYRLVVHDTFGKEVTTVAVP